MATDLIEELRSPVTDRLVLYLINLGVIRPNDFDDEAEKGVRMTKKAINAYLKNYEKFMNAEFVDYKNKQYKSFRKILRENVLQVEKCLLNNHEYQPFIFYS